METDLVKEDALMLQQLGLQSTRILVPIWVDKQATESVSYAEQAKQ